MQEGGEGVCEQARRSNILGEEIAVNNFEIGSNFIKGQMNQNFDLFYFSSILVKCVQYEPNKHTMKFQLN